MERGLTLGGQLSVVLVQTAARFLQRRADRRPLSGGVPALAYWWPTVKAV